MRRLIEVMLPHMVGPADELYEEGEVVEEHCCLGCYVELELEFAKDAEGQSGEVGGGNYNECVCRVEQTLAIHIY